MISVWALEKTTAEWVDLGGRVGTTRFLGLGQEGGQSLWASGL